MSDVLIGLLKKSLVSHAKGEARRWSAQRVRARLSVNKSRILTRLDLDGTKLAYQGEVTTRNGDSIPALHHYIREMLYRMWTAAGLPGEVSDKLRDSMEHKVHGNIRDGIEKAKKEAKEAGREYVYPTESKMYDLVATEVMSYVTRAIEKL